MGYAAYFVEVDLKNKGKWYRVYVGNFDNKEKAQKIGDDLKSNKIITEYFIFKLPDVESKINITQKNDPVRLPTPPKQSTNAANKEKKTGQEAVRKREPLPQAPISLVYEKNRTKADITTAPVVEEKEEANSGSALYDQALGEFKSKQYEKALVSFKEYIERTDTPKEFGQQALRHMADCHYFLGSKGNKENLLYAAEFYKNTLKSFPDPRRENAATYFYLAKTYEFLKYQTEALKTYDILLNKYPSSPYITEANFRIGDILYQTGKYNQAADKLINYLIKYRGDTYAQKAFYLIADSYYKSQQSSNAEVWFRDAQKKWPDLMNVPKDIVLDMGQHKLSLRRFDEAINIFSNYINLYPKDDRAKEVLLLLGNSYKAAAQVSAALTVFNQIIEKYPDSKEAYESTMSMAALGAEKPGMKGLPSIAGIHYYKDPIDALNTVLMKNKTGTIAESALLQKAETWHKLGKDRKSADIYLEFLSIYPQSKMIGEARKGLKLASGSLIDNSYNKQDYLAVADIYFKAYSALPLQDDEYERINKIAVSLKNIDLVEDYVRLLKKYLNVCRDEKNSNKVTVSIAEGKIALTQYDEAEKILTELLARPAMKNSSLIPVIKKNLAEISFKKGMYDKAVVNYEAVVASGQNLNNPGQTYWQYASALKGKKEDSQALQHYLTAVKYFSEDKKPKAVAGETYKDIGDLYLKKNNYKDSLNMYNSALKQTEDPDLKYWSLISIGQSYSKMENKVEAQKTFTQIKTQAGPESFWTKIVDYFIDDENWWGKYGERLKK